MRSPSFASSKHQEVLMNSVTANKMIILVHMSHADGLGPEGGQRPHTLLRQEHCSALSQAGRAPAVTPVGLGRALGRRLSRVREAGDKGMCFPVRKVGPGPRCCCCLFPGSFPALTDKVLM